MMKLKILIYFFTVNTFAQMQQSVKEYYNNINIAEDLILKNDLNGAISFYNKAFKEKKEPFFRDIYNQALCFALLRKKQKCRKNLKILINYGYPKDSLLSNEKFKRIITKLKFKQNLKYDNAYKIAIDSIFERDQFFRKIDRIKFKDSIRKIDSTNVIKLLELIKEKGFPTERKIGVYDYFDYKPFSIIVVHNHIIGYNFSSIILNAIYNGDLDNRIGADLYNLSIANGKDLYGSNLGGLTQYALCKGTTILKKTPFGIYKLDPEIIKEKNKNRFEIGLDDIEINQKKLLFNEKFKGFIFIKYRNKKRWCLESEEDYNKCMEKLITIE